MTHLEEEIRNIKTETLHMFQATIDQVEDGYKALFMHDTAIAAEILHKETLINQMEVDIEKHIENVFALFNPVAIDLRFLMSVLRITYNIEKIADSTKAIAKFVIKKTDLLKEDIIIHINLDEIYEIAFNAVLLSKESFEKEDVKIAYQLIDKNNTRMEEMYDAAQLKVAEYIKQNPDKTDDGLSLLSLLRKIDRMHDQTKNIGKEIIFYLEAKILRHQDNK